MFGAFQRLDLCQRLLYEYSMSTNPAAEHNKAIGAENRQRIREFFRDHIGATRRECAQALGLNECIVGRHVAVIRQEWQNKRKPGKSGRNG